MVTTAAIFSGKTFAEIICLLSSIFLSALCVYYVNADDWYNYQTQENDLVILRLGNLGKLGGFKYLTGGQYVFFEHTFTKRTGLEVLPNVKFAQKCTCEIKYLFKLTSEKPLIYEVSLRNHYVVRFGKVGLDLFSCIGPR